MELTCHNVSFAYNRNAPVITDFTHTFRPGITILKGYSGSGKTTLLKLKICLKAQTLLLAIYHHNLLAKNVTIRDTLALTVAIVLIKRYKKST